MAERYDVVIVGGGIAGGALAVTLTRGGRNILVLERQVTFRDRVRGEAIPPWGGAAAQTLGLVDTLLAAGGGWQHTFVLGDEMVLAPVAADLSCIVPGVPGLLNVGHPDACEALLTLAAKEGATVRRGIGDVSVTLGATPAVAYGWEGSDHEADCRLIVGADGRRSVVRQALGLELRQTPVRCTFGGMLVEGVDGWDSGTSAIGSEGELHYLVFPRPGGRVRVYLGHEPGRQPQLSGAGKEQAFLDALKFACMPGSEALAAGTPAGPAAFFPSLDTWIADGVPYGDGAVLVGDAAGWSDPVIGQGISLSFTDVALISGALLASDDWSCGLFTDYGHERAERMRRVRINAMTHNALWCDFTAAGRARRAEFLRVTAPVAPGQARNPADALLSIPPVLAVQAGPMNMPADAYTDENVTRLLNLGQDDPVPAGRWTY